MAKNKCTYGSELELDVLEVFAEVCIVIFLVPDYLFQAHGVLLQVLVDIPQRIVELQREKEK